MHSNQLTAQEGINGSKSTMLVLATAFATDGKVKLDSSRSSRLLGRENIISIGGVMLMSDLVPNLFA